MGFGMLLCGYFIIFMMSFGMGGYSFVALLAGGLVSYAAAGRLKDYCPSFIATAVCSVLVTLIGVWGAIVFFDSTFLWGLPFVNVDVKYVVDYADAVLASVFHVCMLYSISELAGDLALDKIRSRARWLTVFAILLGVFQMIITAVPALMQVENQMPAKILVLLNLIAYILNTLLIYSCYVHICPKGEENGQERAPSRFKFVNDMRAKMEEKEKRAVRESMEYVKERMEKKERTKEKKRHR